MNDTEIRRSILQYAYDHRHEHPLQIVGIEDISVLKDYSGVQKRHNIKYLKDERLIKTEDDSWSIISITTSGVVVVEDPKELNRRFPVMHDVPQHTKQLIDTVEEMLGSNHVSVLNQFKKAK